MIDRGFSLVEQNPKALAALVRAFRVARGQPETAAPWGRVLVITGAGCSVSAGIPAARQIAQECAVDLCCNFGYIESRDELGETLKAQAKAAVVSLAKRGDLKGDLQDYSYLADHKISELPWDKLYEFFFSEFYGVPVIQNHVIEKVVKRGVKLNWAHVCLGELMRQRFVHTVITVNFDLLALEGAIRAGVIPAVADGFEALSRVRGTPLHPQLIHLHGTCHSYTLRNSADAIRAILANRDADLAVRNLLRDSACILVVGYSAGDPGLATLLQKYNYDNRLFWAAFDTQRESLSEQARAICDSWNAKMLYGVTADGLFRELLRRLDLGIQWMKDPLSGLSEAGDRLLEGEDAGVKQAIEGFRQRVARYRPLLMEASDRIQFELSLAESQRLAGQDLEAIRDLRRLRRKNSESPLILRSLGNALFEVGKEKNRATLLAEAVKALKECLEFSPRETDEDKNAWAQTQTMLGHALISWGELEEGPVQVEEAVTAFRAVLKVHTRESHSLHWAKSQNNLGTALRTLADQKEGTAHLKEAIEAFRAALLEYTCDEFPDQWAMVQTNLGDALTELGNREEGTAYLEEAVSVLRQVFQVRTREGLRAAWAKTQHYFGDALRNLGDRKEGEAGKAHLEEAVMAYQAALEVRTRKWRPIYYARTQDRLGRALASLGNREEGTSRLEEAVVAYRRALGVRSRKGPIRDWADTLCNLANALVALGEREEGMARLKEAIVTARAISEFPEPISTTYASCAEFVLIRAETALRARQ
ncbi:MAG TPA: tetratricopeptide repeat protein [Thermoanaerobaculia bacterium]